MANLVDDAGRTIALLSPAYLDSQFTQSEWQAAFARSARGDRSKLIPVRIEECEPEGLIAAMIYIDLVGLTNDEARQVLLENIGRSRAKPSIPPSFPGASEPRPVRKPPSVQAILDSKLKSGGYDVFLCHNSDDKGAVKDIAVKLKQNGILPWLDAWEIRPGTDWQAALEHQIKKIDSAAVFISSAEFGPWQDLEKKALLQQFLTRGRPMIPVILPKYEGEPSLPFFLGMLHYVDFREADSDPMGQLIWGITGKKPDGLEERSGCP